MAGRAYEYIWGLRFIDSIMKKSERTVSFKLICQIDEKVRALRFILYCFQSGCFICSISIAQQIEPWEDKFTSLLSSLQQGCINAIHS